MIKSRRVIGIELGSENFKMVEASVRGSTIEIHGLIREKIIEAQNDLNPLFAYLESFLKNFVGQKKEIILSIARPEIAELRVEYFTDDRLPEKVIEEIKEKVGLQESIEWVEDSNIVKVKDLNVFFYGRCQKLVSQMLDERIKKTNNNFLALDFGELAIGRVLDFQLGKQSSIQSKVFINCVIDIGLRCTRIHTYYNGVLLLPREIAIGGEAFTQVWCDKAGMSFDQAEDLKIQGTGLSEDYFDRHQSQKTSLSEIELNPWDFLENSYASVYNPFQETQESAMGWSEQKEQESEDFKPYNPFSDSTAGVTDSSVDIVESQLTNSFSFQESLNQLDVVIVEDKQNSTALEDKWLPLLEDLMGEIKRSLDYAQSLGFSVDKLFLTGGGGLIKGLDGYISKSLHIHCQRLNPFEKLKLKMQSLDQEKYLESAQDFSVAIGNILHTIY